MEEKNDIGDYFLGRGGPHPGVDSLDRDGRITELLCLPPGDSVYSLELCPCGSRLAAGTKNGLIVVLPLTDLTDGPNSGFPPISLSQGAPVLSLCWLDDQQLAVSDSLGRLMVWETTGKSEPRTLEALRCPVCSIASSGRDILVGLSLEGALPVWSITTGKIIQSFDGPPPATPRALIRLQPCQPDGTFIYPAQDGNIVILDFQNKIVRTLQVHRGPFSALFQYGQRTFSIGRYDARLTELDIAANRLISDAPSVRGVITAEVDSLEPFRVFMILENGEVGYWGKGGSNIQTINGASGRYYRTVTRIPTWRRSMLESIEIQEIIDRTGYLTQENNDREAESWHQELIRRGYEHVSLAIKSENAFQKCKYMAALEYSVRLVEMLPLADQRSMASIERHIILLSILGLFDDARTWIEKLQIPIFIDKPVFRNIQLIDDYPDPLDRISALDIPLPEAIVAAEVLGREFSGRYVLKTGTRLSCDWSNISALDIAMKCNQNSDRHSKPDFLKAIPRRMAWLSPSHIRESEIVLFTRSEVEFEKLQIAFEVTNTDSSTIVTPVCLFCWSGNGEQDSTNKSAKEAVASVSVDPSLPSRFIGARRQILTALRQLHTAKENTRLYGHANNL